MNVFIILHSQAAYFISKNPSKQGHSGAIFILNVDKRLHFVHYEAIDSQVAHYFSHFSLII
jgi:hypothetical protein